MSSRRQRSIPFGGRYRQVLLYVCVYVCVHNIKNNNIYKGNDNNIIDTAYL